MTTKYTILNYYLLLIMMQVYSYSLCLCLNPLLDDPQIGPRIAPPCFLKINCVETAGLRFQIHDQQMDLRIDKLEWQTTSYPSRYLPVQ